MDLSVLLDYTAWDREQWKASYSAWGTDALRLSMGPETPARRFATSGELVRHIFTAELSDLGGLLQHHDRQVRVQLLQANGSGKAGRAGTDDDDIGIYFS